MKRFIFIISCIIVMAALVSACSGKDSDIETLNTVTEESTSTESGTDAALVGTWSESIFDSGFIFNSDGTGTDTFWDLTFTYQTSGGEVLIIYDTDEYGASKYSYTVSGDQLSMTRLDDDSAETFTYTKTGTEAATTAETAAENVNGDVSD